MLAEKQNIISEYKINEKDTGSPEIQIALLTERIDRLTQHLGAHRKDHSSRYGLIKMVSARRRLLDYLQQRDFERYQKLVGELKIRR